MEMVSKMSNKRFQADALIMIDCWGEDFWHLLGDHLPHFSNEMYCDYMKQWYLNARNWMGMWHFNTLINASYRFKGLSEESDGSLFGHPGHTFDYTTKYVELRDAEIKDIYKYVPPGGKIIVGGGSFGACFHYRDVGACRLIKNGFKVYTNPNICYRQHYIPKNIIPMPDLEFIHDDIVWSRTYESGNLYPELYHGLMIHPDNALDRRDGNNKPMRQI